MDGEFQDDINILPALDNVQLEKIFKLYKTENNQYFYNITKTINIDYNNLNPNTFYTKNVSHKMPWTSISFDEYKTIYLWWLICIINGIDNPVKYAEVGSTIKILKPEFVNILLQEVNLKINNK